MWVGCSCAFGAVERPRDVSFKNSSGAFPRPRRGGVKLIVGLGNPGPRYAGTRHNVGFRVVTSLAERWSIRLKDTLCRAKTGQGSIGGESVCLALPQTMMNASGEAVGCLLKRLNPDLSMLLVICDDVALPLGMIRMRPKGSDGGHQGLASVLEAIRTEAVARLRIGVRSSRPVRAEDLTEFVLGRFAAMEKKPLEAGLQLGRQACETWVARGVSAAMNRFNRRVECPV